MKKFAKALKEFKLEDTGAACFRDDLDNTKHCANGVTEEQARKFAKMHRLVLVRWEAGKTCTEMNC